MCLLTDEKEARTAVWPIVCYKSVCVNYRNLPEKSDDPVFSSMYHGFEYRLNETYAEEGFSPETKDGFVNHGFHSWRLESYALLTCHFAIFHADVVLRCEIPAGARYYAGNDWDLCSDSIRVTAWKYPLDKEWREIKQEVRQEARQEARQEETDKK